VIIGTPADAIAQIERLEKKVGRFGAFLQLAHNWANFDATKKSYELFVRHVLPRFNDSSRGRVESLDWVQGNQTEFGAAAVNAAMTAIQKHNQEQAKKKA
jgi:limonene 1,2-monooxygenase